MFHAEFKHPTFLTLFIIDALHFSTWLNKVSVTFECYCATLTVTNVIDQVMQLVGMYLVFVIDCYLETIISH